MDKRKHRRLSDKDITQIILYLPLQLVFFYSLLTSAHPTGVVLVVLIVLVLIAPFFPMLLRALRRAHYRKETKP